MQQRSESLSSLERVEFPSRRGNRLVGMFHPVAEASAPAAILCHGMESNKDGTKHRMLETRFAALGIATLRFDFSYVGESEGEFADLTFGGEVDDLAGAWAFVRTRTTGPIGLVGSSMGGTVALLFAAEEPDVAALATIAAVGRPEHILDEIRPDERERWRRDGVFSLGGVRLKRSFLDEVETLDVLAACRRVRCPVLVGHGDADRVVPVEDATLIADALVGERRLEIYPGADHRFSDPGLLDRLLDDCVAWISGRVMGRR